MKAKLAAFIFLLSQSHAFANDIVCLSAHTHQVVLKYSSNNSIPDFSFEPFRIHSSYGSLEIYEKELGPIWMAVRNAGHELFYEIKAGGGQVPYVHLSLFKEGIFNGYLQVSSGQTELLQCSFADLYSR